SSGNVRIAARSNKRVEVKLKVFAKLQTSVWVRERHRTLNMTRNCLTRGVRQIIEREDHNVISAANAAVFSSISQKSRNAHLTTSSFSNYGYGRDHLPRCRRWRFRWAFHT